MAAQGGAGNGLGGGAGGNGGAGVAPQGAPGLQAGDSTSRDSGGGGGGAGRIRINSSGTPLLLGTVSPAPSTGLATVARPKPSAAVIPLAVDAGVPDAGAAPPDAGPGDGGEGELPDAGTLEEHDYVVGCGCSGGPGVSLVLGAGLTLLLAIVRRRA